MAIDWAAAQEDGRYPPCYYPDTFSRPDAEQIAFDEEPLEEQVKIRLRQGGGLTLQGTVFEASTGEPVPDALVVAHHEDMLFDRAVTYTDEQGRYRFECLGPGHFLVHVDATPRGFVRTRKRLTMHAGKEAELGFGLRPGVRISGKIADEEGNELPLAKPYGAAYIRGSMHPEGMCFTGVRNRYGAEGQCDNATFRPNEGDYEDQPMVFTVGGSFVIEGMKPGGTWFYLDPWTRGMRVVRVLYGGKDVPESGLETEPGDVIEDVTIVVGGTETKEQ